jgi:SAM-dependent methyltransferase
MIDSFKKINLGCGNSFDSRWDNFDLFPQSDQILTIDLLKPLPFNDKCYDYCYCSHVLEHMPRGYVSSFVSEVFRILKPNGVFRVVVPDLEMITRNYLKELDAVISGNIKSTERLDWMTIELLDQLTRTFSGGFMGRMWYSRPLESRELILERLGLEASTWINKFDNDFDKGAIPLDPRNIFHYPNVSINDENKFRMSGEIHRWMYDQISLASVLNEAGFQKVRKCSATESSIHDFSKYHLDTNRDGNEKKPDSLYMECIK